MIVKLVLMGTKTDSHPMHRDGVGIGFSSNFPEVGHPIILWYNHHGDSRFLRTGRVNTLEEIPLGWIATTDHSQYKIERMKVHLENEAQEFSRSVNGTLPDLSETTKEA